MTETNQGRKRSGDEKEGGFIKHGSPSRENTIFEKGKDKPSVPGSQTSYKAVPDNDRKTN